MQALATSIVEDWVEDFLRDAGMKAAQVTPALFGVPLAVAAVAGWFCIKSWREEKSLSLLAAAALVLSSALGLIAIDGYFQAKKHCESIISPIERQESTFHLFEQPYLQYSTEKCDSLWPVVHLPELGRP